MQKLLTRLLIPMLNLQNDPSTTLSIRYSDVVG